VLLLLLLL
jgi:hypothetical protein